MSGDSINVVKESRQKGKAEAFFAIAELVEFLYSIKLKEEDTTSQDTRVE